MNIACKRYFFLLHNWGQCEGWCLAKGHNSCLAWDLIPWMINRQAVQPSESLPPTFTDIMSRHIKNLIANLGQKPGPPA